MYSCCKGTLVARITCLSSVHRRLIRPFARISEWFHYFGRLCIRAFARISSADHLLQVPCAQSILPPKGISHSVCRYTGFGRLSPDHPVWILACRDPGHQERVDLRFDRVPRSRKLTDFYRLFPSNQGIFPNNRTLN